MQPAADHFLPPWALLGCANHVDLAA